MPNAPTTLCRQDLAFKLLRSTGGPPEPRRFLEIGTGEGELLTLLARRGYRGDSVDVSEAAVQHATRLLEARGVEGITVRRGDLFDETGSYPLIILFEVLEHLERDVDVLAHLASLLEPGGRLILSVPAHMRLWGPTDEIVGHVRRYERQELASRLTEAGLEPLRVWSVAVPVSNALLALRGHLNRRRIAAGGVAADSRERTEGSGLDRVAGAPDAVYALLFNRFTMAPVFALQRAFLMTDLGTGFIAAARRR